MFRLQIITSQIVFLLGCSVAIVAQPPAGGPYTLDQSVIAGGGGSSSGTNGGPTFSISGTIGQNLAGTTSTSSPPQFGLHGGFWQSFIDPTAAAVSVSGRVTTAEGQPISKTVVTLVGSDGIPRTALSNQFGYYRFDGVESGQTYIISGQSKRYQFVPMAIQVMDELTGIDMIAIDQGPVK